MANVKNQFVLWRLKHSVQGNRKLYDTEVRSKMPPDLRKNR